MLSISTAPTAVCGARPAYSGVNASACAPLSLHSSPPLSRQQRQRRQARTRRLCAHASPNDEHFDEQRDMQERLDSVEAYAEAREIFQQASTMASLQTRYDLEVAWASDPQGSGAGAAMDPNTLPSESQVVAFFQEQGLSLSESGRLWREMYQQPLSEMASTGSTSRGPPHVPQPMPYTLETLAARMVRWRRVLPGIDVARVVAKDSAVLSADLGWAMRCLIMLVERMPRRNVMGMIPKLPRILWATDLPERFDRNVSRLVKLHPSGDIDIVLDLLAEHPELLYRLDYYPKATIADELPIEIQNMMIVADQSLEATIRYYRNRRTNYQAEVDGQHLPGNREWVRDSIIDEF